MGKFKRTICKLGVDSIVFPPLTYGGFYIIKDYILR